jgi:hypothetical protein
MPATFICVHCDSTFVGSRSGVPRKYCSHQCSVLDKQPPIKSCITCGKETTNPRFCSHSCSAKWNNKKRVRSKEKISKSLRSKNPLTPEIIGPYTSVYRNVCKKTGLIFYSQTYQKYHPNIYSDRQHYSWLCRFRFSISKYPLWFDGSLIKEHGWYSTPGSRKGVRNLNGVSRDHMVSVQFGYLNGIDPKIISHPANCELVCHFDNNVKNTSCSISLDDLITRINSFESIYPNWQG